MSSLYERIGGAKALDPVVDHFYGLVLADDKINGFFDKTDMVRQRYKQKAFLAFAFGGPVKFDGASMAKGHQHLVVRGLNDSHVDAVAGHLVATLKHFAVDQSLIDEVIAVVESVRDDVLGRGQRASA